MTQPLGSQTGASVPKRRIGGSGSPTEAEYFSTPTDRVGASLSFLTSQLLYIPSIWTAYAFRPWISHSLSCFEIVLSGVGTSVALLGIALSSLLTPLVALQALCPLVLHLLGLYRAGNLVWALRPVGFHLGKASGNLCWAHPSRNTFCLAGLRPPPTGRVCGLGLTRRTTLHSFLCRHAT